MRNQRRGERSRVPGRDRMKSERARTGEDVMKKDKKEEWEEREGGRERWRDREKQRGREGRRKEGRKGWRKEGRKSEPRPPAEKLSSQGPRVSIERGSCTAWPHG